MASMLRPETAESIAPRSIPGPMEAARLFDSIATHPREIVAFAYFDPDWRLLGLRHSLSPAIDMVRLCARGVARDALAFDAQLVVMAHNHPSGDPRPSADDVATTRALAHLLDAIDMCLVDHLVLTRHGCTSLRAERMI